MYTSIKVDLVATYWSFGKAADLRQIDLAFHTDTHNLVEVQIINLD